MTTTQEALRLAEEAIEYARQGGKVGSGLYGKALAAIREVREQPAEQEPVAFADLYSVAGRLALELECLLMDTKDLSVVSKWWDTALDALDQWRSIKDTAPNQPAEQEPVACWGMDVNGEILSTISNRTHDFNGEGLYKVPLYRRPLPLAPQEKRPQNCGTGYCSCIECPYEQTDQFRDATKMVQPAEQEPVSLWGDDKFAPHERPLPKTGKCECGDKQEMVEFDYGVYCKTCGWRIKGAKQPAEIGQGACGGCSKKAADGWALYCVECWEKAEQTEQEPVAKVCHDLPGHIGWNPCVAVNEIPEGMPMFSAPPKTEQEPVAGYDITQREDGEGFVVPTDEVYGLVCCDCGLVHDVVWSYDKDTNELGMAAKRNDEATKQRRAEQTEQEPLYISKDCAERGCACHYSVEVDGEPVALYTAPPKREWVSLTDDEIMDLVRDECVDMRWPSTPLFIARAIEAALKEKNRAGR